MFEWIVMFVVVETGIQPLVHITSGRKLVISRLCTSQAGGNWLSTACAHLKRATTTQQNKKAPEPAQILRDFSAF